MTKWSQDYKAGYEAGYQAGLRRHELNAEEVALIVVQGVRYVTLNQARRVFAVSRRTIYNWMDAGLIQWATGPSGKRYIAESELAIRPHDELSDGNQPSNAKRAITTSASEA